MNVYQKIDRLGDELLSNATEVAQEKQRDDINTPIELTNDTGTYLDQLNEDCLLEIFSNPLLTPGDLCSLSRTCYRFNQIIQRLFPKHFEISFDDTGYKFRTKKIRKLPIEMKDVEPIVKNFGSQLVSLSVHRWDSSFVNLIASYSDTITLKRLSIHQDYHQHQDLLLHFWDRIWSIDQLTLLEINLDVDSWFKFAISKRNFWNLRQFIFCQTPPRRKPIGIEASDTFLWFFVRQMNLRFITFCGNTMSCKRNFISTVANRCTNLEELSLRGLHMLSDDGPTIRQNTKKLKLKVLDFSAKSNDLQLPLLLQLSDTLEQLKVSDVPGVAVEMYDILSQMQNLRELHLSGDDFTDIPWKKLAQLRILNLRGSEGTLDNVHTPNIVRELINLVEFEFHDRYHYFETSELCKLDYDEIVKLVELQQREDVLTLICSFNFKYVEDCGNDRNVRLVKTKNL